MFFRILERRFWTEKMMMKGLNAVKRINRMESCSDQHRGPNPNSPPTAAPTMEPTMPTPSPTLLVKPITTT